ncbi:6516_t:CDS:1, partial [Racocetra persica]
ATKINFSSNNPYKNDIKEEKVQKLKTTEISFSSNNLYKNDIEE